MFGCVLECCQHSSVANKQFENVTVVLFSASFKRDRHRQRMLQMMRNENLEYCVYVSADGPGGICVHQQ